MRLVYIVLDVEFSSDDNEISSDESGETGEHIKKIRGVSQRGKDGQAFLICTGQVFWRRLYMTSKSVFGGFKKNQLMMFKGSIFLGVF